MSLQRCSCAASSAFEPIGDGRHFLKCKKCNVRLQIHDRIRDVLILMTKTAGLGPLREPMGVLPDDTGERPADLLIPNWSVDGVEFTTHAVDFTCSLSDSSWNGLNSTQRALRATKIGVAGEAAEEKKRANQGAVREQQRRGNSDPMSLRCSKQERSIFGQSPWRATVFPLRVFRILLTMSVTQRKT
jgi:hypothetical protein